MNNSLKAHANINQAWRTHASSNFRSRRRSRAAAAWGLGEAVYHLLHRRRDVWPSVIGAIHDRAVSA